MPMTVYGAASDKVAVCCIAVALLPDTGNTNADARLC